MATNSMKYTSDTRWSLGGWATRQVSTHVGPVVLAEGGMMFAALLANAAGALGTAEYISLVRGDTLGIIVGVSIELAMLGGATMKVYDKQTRVISVFAMLMAVGLSGFFNTLNAIEVHGNTRGAWAEGVGFVLFAAALSFAVHYSQTSRTARIMAEEKRQQDFAEEQARIEREEQREQDRQDAEFKRQQERDQYTLKMQWNQERTNIEIEAERAKKQEELRAIKRASRVQQAVQVSSASDATCTVQVASGRSKQDIIEEQRCAILQSKLQSPDATNADIAAALGISLRSLQTRIAELKKDGRLAKDGTVVVVKEIDTSEEVAA